jgi:nitrogen fixation NifU-like protein
LGKLSVFSGVREFPTRIKCASLAWHTMKAAVASDPALALSEVEGPVSTE